MWWFIVVAVVVLGGGIAFVWSLVSLARSEYKLAKTQLGVAKRAAQGQPSALFGQTLAAKPKPPPSQESE